MGTALVGWLLHILVHPVRWPPQGRSPCRETLSHVQLQAGAGHAGVPDWMWEPAAVKHEQHYHLDNVCAIRGVQWGTYLLHALLSAVCCGR